jgi:hypothetical protein
VVLSLADGEGDGRLHLYLDCVEGEVRMGGNAEIGGGPAIVSPAEGLDRVRREHVLVHHDRDLSRLDVCCPIRDWLRSREGKSIVTIPTFFGGPLPGAFAVHSGGRRSFAA